MGAGTKLTCSAFIPASDIGSGSSYTSASQPSSTFNADVQMCTMRRWWARSSHCINLIQPSLNTTDCYELTDLYNFPSLKLSKSLQTNSSTEEGYFYEGKRHSARQQISKLTSWSTTFLVSCKLCNYSRIFQHFTEPKRLLLCSQEPSTGPYSGPD
jgi:hypothetical protein